MSDPDEGVVVPDERGDVLEAVFWGGILLFTLALFVWEFGVGFLDPAHGHGGAFPMGVIGNFKQALFLASLIGGGGVVVLVIYAVFRYSAGVRSRPEPLQPGQGSFKMAIFTIGVTTIMLATVFQGAAVLAQTDEAGAASVAERQGIDQQIHVDVQAAQWSWRFDVDGVQFTQGEQVVLPANTLVVFETTSADVVHSFSIKELGVTKDAIPGETNEAAFAVDHVDGETEYSYTNEAGDTERVAADIYQVRCAELCGKGHSKMIATIYVVSTEDYEHWAADVGAENGIQHLGEDGDDHADEEDDH